MQCPLVMQICKKLFFIIKTHDNNLNKVKQKHKHKDSFKDYIKIYVNPLQVMIWLLKRLSVSYKKNLLFHYNEKMVENKDHSTTTLGFKFLKFILFSNIHIPRMYPINLFFVHLLGSTDTM